MGLRIKNHEMVLEVYRLHYGSGQVGDWTVYECTWTVSEDERWRAACQEGK